MSQLEENLTTEYLYSEPVVAVETQEKESGRGMYTFLSVFFFILALAGLFIGMITAVWAKFQQPSLFIDFLDENGKTSVFSYCMLGKMVSIIADLFGAKNISTTIYPSLLSTSGKVWFITNLFLIFAIVLVAVLALVLMIIAITSKTKRLARMCALVSGMVLFLVYGGYFLLAYAIGGLIDAPTALIGGLILITLITVAIIERKIYGFLSSLLLILTVVTVMMLTYSDAILTRSCVYWSMKDPLSGSLISGGAFDLYSGDLFLGIAMTLLIVVLAFNFVSSVLRISPKGSFVFDAVRYGVQLLAVILTIIAFMVSKNFGTWDIFTTQGQTLATVLLLVCSIATFVVALLETLLTKKNETVQEVVEAAPQPVYEPAYMGYAPVIQPIVVAQPPVQPVYQQPVYQQPVYQQPQPQPAQPAETHVYVQSQQPAPQPQPAETHVYVQQAERPDVPVTEFERRMQSIARGNSSVYEPSPVPVTQQRMNAEKPNTYEKQRTVKNQAPSNSYVYEGSQYAYDPFIRTLTVQERNEFGDLFIANIYGLRSYLPTYVIGGDNKVFFDRVFIYLGCYRNYISQELLDKIYLYVSKQ